MDYNKLADLLYPHVDKNINKFFEKYPGRKLLNGAVVSRFAPSPTGYLHIGGLFQCVTHEMLTRKPSSVFYLRLEDTDQKREIENAGSLLYETLLKFGIEPTEGYRGNLEERGMYGPYVQSQRLDIYKVFAKYLVSRGRAYPCFCEKCEDKEEIAAKREQEIEANNTTIDHDPCRKLSYEVVEENIAMGKAFALRLLSKGNPEAVMEVDDLGRGKRKIRENGKDIVLIKNNGVPVYSFAHVVDDTLMGTTMVVRGEDWFQSVASHIELFRAFGFEEIPYLHTPNICKLDDGKKRKLSKRKDPEADSRYFLEQGYPVDAVKEYLLNLINSDFEDWRRANPTKHYREFPFAISKISTSNPMFDMVKLNDVSKDYIARLSAEDVYKQYCQWLKEYDPEYLSLVSKNSDYAFEVFNIERECEKPRKDISCWSMVKDYYNYMFADYKDINIDFATVTSIDNELLYKILHTYVVLFEESLTKDEWFDRLKKMAEKHGYCVNNKEFKANPEAYNGNLASFCNMIRYAFTGKTNTPDLYSICCVLGKEELFNRLDIIKSKLRG
ncbi:MAG: glutamate--tRNA ligase [Clostridiales bacterium]|nr:glutamate--tRNA ligase [Clostridiales bacterium]